MSVFLPRGAVVVFSIAQQLDGLRFTAPPGFALRSVKRPQVPVSLRLKGAIGMQMIAGELHNTCWIERDGAQILFINRRLCGVDGANRKITEPGLRGGEGNCAEKIREALDHLLLWKIFAPDAEIRQIRHVRHYTEAAFERKIATCLCLGRRQRCFLMPERYARLRGAATRRKFSRLPRSVELRALCNDSP